MPAWAVWLIVAVVCAVGEIATPGMFVLVFVALAAAVAAVVDAVGGGLVAQLLVFILGSLATIGVLRPVARRHLAMPAHVRTGTAALVGARGLVLERVDGNGGKVKIGGEEWSARAFLDGSVIEPGKSVEIAKIEGATALVYE